MTSLFWPLVDLSLRGSRVGCPECAQQPNKLEAGLNHGYSVQAPSPVAVFRPRTVFPPFPQEVSSKGSCLVGIFFRAPWKHHLRRSQCWCFPKHTFDVKITVCNRLGNPGIKIPSESDIQIIHANTQKNHILNLIWESQCGKFHDFSTFQMPLWTFGPSKNQALLCLGALDSKRTAPYTSALERRAWLERWAPWNAWWNPLNS